MANQDLHPREGASEVGASDRRAFSRHRYDQPVQVVWMDGLHVQRQVYEYRAMDLSRGGVRLVGKQMQYPGTLGLVLLRKPNGVMQRYGVRTCNTEYASDLLYAAGCTFVPVDERLMRATRVVHGRLELSTNAEDYL